MTTPAAAKHYSAEHEHQMEGKGWAVVNPHNRPIQELPIIYGFNNGGSPGLLYAALLAQDGTPLGSHGCSSEGFMPYDLGVIEGQRPDRHETFREHYPGGYRMEFVPSDAVKTHEGLMAAIELAEESQ